MVYLIKAFVIKVVHCLNTARDLMKKSFFQQDYKNEA